MGKAKVMHSTQPHALLTGGGTGGHVFPALAVGEELSRRGWRISFAGSPTGLEAKWVPARGVDFYGLSAYPVLGRGLFGKLKALMTLALSSLSGWRLIRRIGAQVVVSTGGFASAPAVLGGRLAGRPVLLIEPNAQPGLANRKLSRWAKAAVVAFREAAETLDCPAETTGVPIRQEFFDVPTWVGGQDSRPLRVLVLGGSQGARSLNLALPRAVAELKKAGLELRLLHQCGGRHFDETKAAYAQDAESVDRNRAGEGRLEEAIRIVPFLNDVAAALAATDLVVCRAGALTVAELCAAGRASVLVPLSIAAGHQKDNANLLAAAGACEVVDESPDTDDLAARLAETLEGLASDRAVLGRMAAAARTLARPHATEDIADRVEALTAAEASR